MVARDLGKGGCGWIRRLQKFSGISEFFDETFPVAAKNSVRSLQVIAGKALRSWGHLCSFDSVEGRKYNVQFFSRSYGNLPCPMPVRLIFLFIALVAAGDPGPSRPRTRCALRVILVSDAANGRHGLQTAKPNRKERYDGCARRSPQMAQRDPEVRPQSKIRRRAARRLVQPGGRYDEARGVWNG